MTACAHCGTTMPTPTGRASRKRYCTDDCRKTAWRHRHHDDPARGPAVPAVPAVTTAFPNDVPHVVPAVPTAFPDDVPTPGGQHRCPHCRQPLAVISVVIPAAAAIIRPPEVPHNRSQQR